MSWQAFLSRPTLANPSARDDAEICELVRTFGEAFHRVALESDESTSAVDSRSDLGTDD
jgi:hypothetical protein